MTTHSTVVHSSVNTPSANGFCLSSSVRRCCSIYLFYFFAIALDLIETAIFPSKIFIHTMTQAERDQLQLLCSTERLLILLESSRRWKRSAEGRSWVVVSHRVIVLLNANFMHSCGPLSPNLCKSNQSYPGVSEPLDTRKCRFHLNFKDRCRRVSVWVCCFV